MFRQFILVLVVVFAVVVAHPTEEDKKIHDECAEKLGFEPGPPPKRGERPSEEERKKHHCMMKCHEEKKGIIDENGDLNAEKIQEKMNVDEDKAKSAVEACNSLTADDDCDKVAEKMHCLRDELRP